MVIFIVHVKKPNNQNQTNKPAAVLLPCGLACQSEQDTSSHETQMPVLHASCGVCVPTSRTGKQREPSNTVLH